MRLKIIALLAVIVGGTAYSELQPTTKNAYETSRWAVYPAFDRPMFYVLQVDGHEYIVMWQYEERSITHSGNCTNHAPLVVTNVITVTNECSYTNVVLPRIIGYNATTQYDRYERVTENILVTNDTFSSWYETIGTNTIEHSTNVWVVGWRTAETTLPSAVIHRMTYGFGTSEVFSICTLQTVDSGATGDWRNGEHRMWNVRAVWSEFPTVDAGVEAGE